MSATDRSESGHQERAELDREWSEMSADQQRAQQQQAEERLQRDAAEWEPGESFNEQMGEEMSVKGPGQAIKDDLTGSS